MAGRNWGFSPYRSQNNNDFQARRNFGSSANRGNYYPSRNQAQAAKRSGAKFGYSKGDNARPYVTGWKANKREGLTKFIAAPYSGTGEHKSRTSGRIYHNWVCKVTPQTGKPYLVGCLYEPASGKVNIPEMSIVMNPKGGRGGYCGRNFVPKNR